MIAGDIALPFVAQYGGTRPDVGIVDKEGAMKRLMIWGLALTVAVIAPRSLAGEMASVNPGDRVVSELAASDRDRVTFYVPAASLLDLQVVAAQGLEVVVRLFNPLGAEVSLAEFARSSTGRKLRARAVPVTTAGEYAIEVASQSGGGTYSLSTKLRPRKPAGVDLRKPHSLLPTLVIPAGNVGFDPSTTTLGSSTVQDLGEELALKGATLGSDPGLTPNRGPNRRECQ